MYSFQTSITPPSPQCPVLSSSPQQVSVSPLFEYSFPNDTTQQDLIESTAPVSVACVPLESPMSPHRWETIAVERLHLLGC